MIYINFLKNSIQNEILKCGAIMSVLNLDILINRKDSTLHRLSANNSEVIIAHDDVVVETGDHVILFLVDKKHTRDIEQLFQVGFTFF